MPSAMPPSRRSTRNGRTTRWCSTNGSLCRPASGASDTLARVQALTQHPDFDLRNPNRVRALIGAFTGNPAKFHDASGAGYALLADTILTLDAMNPQIAARLATALGTWRRYDAARQALMKAQIERILAKEKLSHNTYEMASKALA